MISEAPRPAAALLAPAIELAERGFLAAGRSLERAVVVLEHLQQRFGRYIAVLDTTALDATTAELHQAGCQVTRLAAAHASDAAALEALGGILGGISARLAALQPITAEVEMLAVSARLVAGSMGEAGTAFAGFSQDIQRTARQAQAGLQHLRAYLIRASRDLAAARQDATDFTRQHGGSIATIPGRLEATLHALATRQHQAAGAAGSVREQAALIHQQVAQQIVALQLGDITRQRLEHMMSGTQLLADAGTPCPSAAGIIAAQLADAAAILRTEGEQIEQRLRLLATAAAAIQQLGRDLHDSAAERTCNFAAGLEADIRQTALLFGHLRQADGKGEQTIRSLLRDTAELVQQLAGLQSVDEDLHILGLNATLKCGRLGIAGRALAAVAQELRSCSRRFAGAASDVLRDLERLQATAANLFDPARNEQHAALAGVTGSMTDAVSRLQQLEHDLDSGMADLHGDADAVAQLVDEALRSFAVRHGVAGRMLEVVDSLNAAAGICEADGSADRALVERIAQTYTMERERAVHAALTGEKPAAAAADASDTDCFLF